jgi:hypothetical protein
MLKHHDGNSESRDRGRPQDRDERPHMAQVTPANTYPGLTKKRGAAPGGGGVRGPRDMARMSAVAHPLGEREHCDSSGSYS